MLLDASSETDLRSRIKHLKQKGEETFKLFRRRAEARRNRYYGKHYASDENQELITLTPEMRLVDKAYGLLSIDPPKISARPEEETEEGLKEADRLEAWLEGLHYLQCLRQGQDPYLLSIYDALITGMGIFWVLWDSNRDSRGSTGEEGYLDEVPIVIKRRDPCKVLLQEGGSRERWQWCMHVDKIPIADIEAEWNVTLKDHPEKYEKRLTKEEEVWDFWCYEQGQVVNTVLTPKQILKPPAVMEQYDYLPVVAWFCRETPDTQWENKGLPITAPIEKTTPIKEKQVNLLLRANNLLGQLPLVYKGQGERPVVPSGYGNVISIGLQDEFGFLQWPGHPPDMYQMLNILDAEIEAGSLGSPLTSPAGKSTSGYALSLSGQAGTLQLVAPEQALSLALTQVLQKVCCLCANFAPDLEMRVFGKYENQRKVFALTGAQMEGFFIDVEVSAQFPEDKDRKMAYGLQLSAMGDQSPLDSRTVTEDFLGYPNATNIRERKRVEMAEQHPLIQIAQIVDALSRRGLQDWLPLLLGQQGQQPLQPPGQGSVPNMAPNQPAPGVSTTVAPQEEVGAVRSQEMGVGPGNRMGNEPPFTTG